MRMSRPSRMTAIAPSAIRRRSVFIEQPRTAQVSASERSRSSPTGSVFVIWEEAFVSLDAGQLTPRSGTSQQPDERDQRGVRYG